MKVSQSKLEGWSQLTLGKIGEPQMCKRVLKSQTVKEKCGSIPFYKIGTFGKKPDSFIPKELYEEFVSKYNFPKKGDVLISASGTIGRLVVYNGQPAYYQDSNIVWLSHDESLVLNSYLYYLYQRVDWQPSDGGVIKRLYNSNIQSISVLLPPLPEQQKIAEILSTVDAKIENIDRQIAETEKLKKGLMQKLLTEGIGHTEFKDSPLGRIPKSWEVKRLDELTKVYDGTHQTPKYVESGIPFYSVEHVTQNQFDSTKYISEEVFEKEIIRVRLERNDILMSRIGDVGTVRLIDWDVRASFYVSLALIKSNSRFNSAFLKHFLSGMAFQKELYKRIIHTAFPKKINLGELNKCLVAIPTLIEQYAIKDILDSIDDKIDLLKKESVENSELKRGLMQKLLTGQIRVTFLLETKSA